MLEGKTTQTFLSTPKSTLKWKSDELWKVEVKNKHIFTLSKTSSSVSELSKIFVCYRSQLRW